MVLTAMAKATGKTALDLLMFLLQETRRLFFCLLLAFEFLFIEHSFRDLVLGGTGMMVAWWWHLQLEITPPDHFFVPAQWWMIFGDQLLVLALVGALWLFERRHPRRLGRNVRPA